jgi:coenzyme F420-0:L-glutamate ligase/coenzyme F420-1:gamma-L-glutamate ligase
MISSITYTALPDLPLVEPGDDLISIIVEGVRRARLNVVDGDVFIVAQKIVSKSENRYVNLADVTPSTQALELAKVVSKDPRFIEVVLSESSEIVRCSLNVMIVAHRLGFVMANAGIDQSNIPHPEGSQVLLLPKDPDASSEKLRRGLCSAFGVDAGIVINDSFGRPWRNGVVGVAIGSAGISSLRSMIGEPDLFDRAMRMTEIAVADELAAAGSLVMGQCAEGQPVVHVRGFSSPAPASPALALVRPRGQDLFR